MSRTDSFRPQLDACEDRNAPGSLLGTGEPPEFVLNPVVAAAAQQAATQTTRPVVDFATGTIVFGESTLTRTDHGITMHLTVEGVPAGVYSAWMPIFHPGGTVPAVAGRVGGHVVGEGGKLTITVHLNEGEVISGHPVFPSGALTDAQGQDIGMVIRYHGPVEPGNVYSQTHTFEAGDAIDFLRTRHNA